MKVTYSKIVLIMFISLSTASTLTMEYVTNLQNLLSTKEAGTILTTAGLLGCYYASYLTLRSIDMRRQNYEGYALIAGRIAKDVIEEALIFGIPLGITRVFAEKYGSWPQEDSSKPLLIDLTASALICLCRSFATSDKNSLKRCVAFTNDLMCSFPYCVLRASAWTALQRYKNA